MLGSGFDSFDGGDGASRCRFGTVEVEVAPGSLPRTLGLALALALALPPALTLTLALHLTLTLTLNLTLTLALTLALHLTLTLTRNPTLTLALTRPPSPGRARLAAHRRAGLRLAAGGESRARQHHAAPRRGRAGYG